MPEQVNDPDRKPVIPVEDTSPEEQERLANIRTLQEKQAVDENDPRVVPHLDTVSQSAAFDADEQARREAAIRDTKAMLEDDAARIAAARANLAAAQDALAQAITTRDGHLDTLNKLDQAVIVPPVAHVLSPGEATQPFFFPRSLQFIANGKTVTFPAGVHPVPESLSPHWWLTDNGARPYKGTIPAQSDDGDATAEAPKGQSRIRPVNDPDMADMTAQ